MKRLLIIGLAGALVLAVGLIAWATTTPPSPFTIYDNPKVSTYNAVDFNYLGWGGYWVRHTNRWVQFRFENIAPIPRRVPHVVVVLNLMVTNKMNGQGGLDGLVTAVVNPNEQGRGPRVRGILLDNTYKGTYPWTNVVQPYYTNGSYDTHAQFLVKRGWVRNGTLTIRLLRHTDNSGAPDATAGDYVPLLVSRNVWGRILSVPPNVYEANDPMRVHLGVQTADANGEVAASGVCVLIVPQARPGAIGSHTGRGSGPHR